MPSLLLRRAAGRAEDDPFFLGSALAAYRTGEELDDAGLARRLGCSPADLPRLALCRRPASRDASFGDDVHQIAAWANVDADSLASVVRYAESVEALRRMPPHAGAGGGTLLAARDLEPAPGIEPEPGTGAGTHPAPPYDESKQRRRDPS